MEMEEKQHAKEHGISSGTGGEGRANPGAFAKEFLHACDPVVFANDCPDHGHEQQEIEITVPVEPSVRVSH